MSLPNTPEKHQLVYYKMLVILVLLHTLIVNF